MASLVQLGCLGCQDTHLHEILPWADINQSGTLHFDVTHGWSCKIATYCTSQYYYGALTRWHQFNDFAKSHHYLKYQTVNRTGNIFLTCLTRWDMPFNYHVAECLIVLIQVLAHKCILEMSSHTHQPMYHHFRNCKSRRILLGWYLDFRLVWCQLLPIPMGMCCRWDQSV